MNDNTEVFVTEHKYFVKIVNPCLRTNSIVSSTISDVEVWVKAAAVRTYFMNFDDQATVAYGAANGSTALCGPKTYTLYKTDKLTLQTEAYLALTVGTTDPSKDWELTLVTSDPVYYTNSNVAYHVRVQLDDYVDDYPDEVVHFEPFNINIKNCQIHDFVTVAVPLTTYNVYTPVVYIPITEFVQDADDAYLNGAECGYTLTYTARWFTYWGTRIELPPWIVWDQNNWRFEVYTDDPTKIDDYTIELHAEVLLTDMNPIYEET